MGLVAKTILSTYEAMTSGTSNQDHMRTCEVMTSGIDSQDYMSTCEGLCVRCMLSVLVVFG